MCYHLFKSLLNHDPPVVVVEFALSPFFESSGTPLIPPRSEKMEEELTPATNRSRASFVLNFIFRFTLLQPPVKWAAASFSFFLSFFLLCGDLLAMLIRFKLAKDSGREKKLNSAAILETISASGRLDASAGTLRSRADAIEFFLLEDDDDDAILSRSPCRFRLSKDLVRVV